MGHAFTFCMFDILVRFVEANGVRVRYVQNVTDVDDPLFERARRDGVDWRALADRETKVHIRDMTALGWRPPDFMPRVSEEIDRITAAATRLHRAGFAYKTDALYFDVSRYRRFGGLSHRTRQSMLRKLRKTLDNVLVVTMGEHGASALAGDRFYHEPAFLVHAVDTTGAGDVFRGGFIYALVNGQPMDQALRTANAAAAVSCTRLGALNGVPTLAEVRDLMTANVRR